MKIYYVTEVTIKGDDFEIHKKVDDVVPDLEEYRKSLLDKYGGTTIWLTYTDKTVSYKPNK